MEPRVLTALFANGDPMGFADLGRGLALAAVPGGDSTAPLPPSKGSAEPQPVPACARPFGENCCWCAHPHLSLRPKQNDRAPRNKAGVCLDSPTPVAFRRWRRPSGSEEAQTGETAAAWWVSQTGSAWKSCRAQTRVCEWGAPPRAHPRGCASSQSQRCTRFAKKFADHR